MKPQKVIQFRNETGISPSLIKQLLQQGRKYGLTEIKPFDVQKIVIAEWVNLKCSYGCNRFGTSWCCPPATPGPDKARAILAEYSQALLLEGKKKLP